jgi:uncharacterized protein (TIGR02284 family)
MIGFNVYKAPAFLLEKMNNILSLLRRGKRQYEQVAITAADKDLRCTMLSLAQETNQYACELSSQIHTLGGAPEVEKIDDDRFVEEIKKLNSDNEKITFCQKNERKMIGAYQEILKGSLLYEGLRKMIRYQLNEMLCAFMRVKQLRYLKFHKTNFTRISPRTLL